MLSDKELVKSITLNNNTALFEKLYDRYSKVVYNTSFSYTKNEFEAEDLTQDIFLKLFLNLKKFQGNSKFSTWLFSLTRNHCINAITRKGAKEKRNQSVFYLDIENLGITEDSDSQDFENNQIDNMFAAIKQIPEADKNILFLKYKEELSIKDIANALSIGESAVKMRLKRAKSKLSDQMPIAV
jgi:RNA polymerase sigma-70 factor (ECF subfamily)